MESFGNLLREKREEKNISLETVSRDTAISKQYLEALETENTDIFPGYTYVIGFLSNYSDYLGLDASYITKLFQGKTLQESPVPENLIIKNRMSKKLIAVIIGGALVLCTAAGFSLLYFINGKPDNTGVTAVDLNAGKGQSYTVSPIPLQQRLYKGDNIKLSVPGNVLTVNVENTLNALALETPIGLQYVELGEELEMDIDGNGSADLVVFLSDISKTDENLGAEVRMFAKADTGAPPASVETAAEGSIALDSGKALKEGSKHTVILQDKRAYPFTINASFRGVCLYRYKSDRHDAVETLLSSGDTLKMSAQNVLRVWISNANTVKMQVLAEGRYYDLEIGRPGQVSVQDIRWIKDSDGSYKLTVAEVD